MILLKKGTDLFHKSQRLCKKHRNKRITAKGDRKNLFLLVSEESIAMAQNCWRSAATNGIYLPVYVVIVDDMNERSS